MVSLGRGDKLVLDSESSGERVEELSFTEQEGGEEGWQGEQNEKAEASDDSGSERKMSPVVLRGEETFGSAAEEPK